MAEEKKSDIPVLGPLAALAGVWEGEKGDDTAPSDDRGVEKNKFRERITFTPIARVDNHEQTLWGLRYAKMAWRLGEDNPFHEEVGYWLYDPKARQVMACFIVPRGVVVLAGGTAEVDASSFSLAAELGSETYGICSNKFLDVEFRTERFELTVTMTGPDSFSYDEDTQLRLKRQKEIFHHRDRNTLKRVKAELL